MIGFGFIPSGMKKVLGERFTLLGVDTPVGFFFEGLYQSGFYWKFLGLGQVLAALLLMSQRFATLGALLFFFIISNIWVITLSIHFAGTTIITTLMMLAVAGLLVWDIPRLKFLVLREPLKPAFVQPCEPGYSGLWVRVGLFLFVWSTAGSYFLRSNSRQLYALLFLAVLPVTVILATIADYRKRRRSVAR